MNEVLIVPTGTANVASVCAAFTRLGAQPRLSEDRRELERASCLVLPGVGAFGAAMQRLEELGITEMLRERIQAGRPTLAICLGMRTRCVAGDRGRLRWNVASAASRLESRHASCL